MIIELLMIVVVPIVFIGLVINFIVTQYRIHKRDKKMWEILEKK